MCRVTVWIGTLSLLLGCCMACQANSTPIAEPVVDSSPVVATRPAATATLPDPTSTPLPLAALVNGQPLLLADYEAALLRYEKTVPELPSDYRTRVLDELIDRQAQLQSISAAGFSLLPADVAAAQQQQQAAFVSPAAYQDWLQQNFYTEADFERDLAADMLITAYIQQLVLPELPMVAEQVQARQILVPERAQAENILAQLQGGADFATLALANSIDQSTRPSGGDLGWAPRGAYVMPTIEEAVFAMAVGERKIIESEWGFHVIELLAKDPARPLEMDSLAWQQLYQAAVEKWQVAVRAAAVVERFVP